MSDLNADGMGTMEHLQHTLARQKLATLITWHEALCLRLLRSDISDRPSANKTGHANYIALASCRMYGQPFRHTSSPRPTPISLTACTHFDARLGAFFY